MLIIKKNVTTSTSDFYFYGKLLNSFCFSIFWSGHRVYSLKIYVCVVFIRLIISSLSLARASFTSHKNQLSKYLDEKKKCIRYSWFHWWVETTQKQLTFFYVKNKSSTNFLTKFYFRARRVIWCKSRFDLLLEHISFVKLSNWLETSYFLVKGEKDKVGQSYKKNLKTVWHGITILLKNAFSLLLVCFIFVPQVIKYI